MHTSSGDDAGMSQMLSNNTDALQTETSATATIYCTDTHRHKRHHATGQDRQQSERRSKKKKRRRRRSGTFRQRGEETASLYPKTTPLSDAQAALLRVFPKNHLLQHWDTARKHTLEFRLVETQHAKLKNLLRLCIAPLTCTSCIDLGKKHLRIKPRSDEERK